MAASAGASKREGIEWRPPNGRWTAKEAHAGLDAARAAGEPLSKFARRHGIQESRLYWWKKELSKKPPTGIGIFPVRVVGGARDTKCETVETARDTKSTIDVVIDGRTTVRVGKGFDGELLRSVVAVLRGLRC